MKCVDCLADPNHLAQEATNVLVLDDKILPLCDAHLKEYIYMEGEINLDFYAVKISGVGEKAFVDRINEVFAFHEKKYEYLLGEYNKLKKEVDGYHEMANYDK